MNDTDEHMTEKTNGESAVAANKEPTARKGRMPSKTFNEVEQPSDWAGRMPSKTFSEVEQPSEWAGRAQSKTFSSVKSDGRTS